MTAAVRGSSKFGPGPSPLPMYVTTLLVGKAWMRGLGEDRGELPDCYQARIRQAAVPDGTEPTLSHRLRLWLARRAVRVA